MRLSFCDVRRSWEPHRQRRQSRPDVLPCRQARAIRRCGVAVARQHRARDIFWQWHRRTGLSTWVHSWHTIFAPALSRRTRAAPGCTRAGGHGEGEEGGSACGAERARVTDAVAPSGQWRCTPHARRGARASRDTTSMFPRAPGAHAHRKGVTVGRAIRHLHPAVVLPLVADRSAVRRTDGLVRSHGAHVRSGQPRHITTVCRLDSR